MRNPKQIVYGSSYDRGLEHLLKMWPEIKKEVPDAKLRIFYGWNLFDMVAKGNPQMQDWKDKMCKLMLQDGITELGRISHGALEQEYKMAGIWAYPTHFGEISCITAMKAQACGAVPVVVDYAALHETVQHGIKVDGDIYDQETKDEFRKQLVSLLKDEKRQEEIRKVMVPWAQKKFAWSEVAKQWDTEFRNKPSLEKQIDDLMENNQALKAWDLVKDETDNNPIKQKLWSRVAHAFDPEKYKEYYSTRLVENPVTEEAALDCTRIAPRFAWVMPKIFALKPNTLTDLGCADGYLCSTAAKNGIKSVGYNLYKPSVELANKRSERLGLNALFINSDLFKADMRSDVVVMMEVLEHLPDPQAGVDHAMSLLEDNGHAFFSTPRNDHIGVQQHKDEVGHKKWDEDLGPAGHLRLFTEEEFRNLFKNYKIVDFYLDAERCMCVEVVK